MARAKTPSLPGVPNGKIIKEVSEAAERYEAIRNSRQQLTEQEVIANGELVSVMKKHKLKVYKDDDYDPPLIVELAAKDPSIKAKVKRERAAAAEED